MQSWYSFDFLLRFSFVGHAVCGGLGGTRKKWNVERKNPPAHTFARGFFHALFNHRFACAHLPCLARALYTVVVTKS